MTPDREALLVDVRRLVQRGVEPRPDGLHRSPTAGSLAIAERLIASLPDDVATPTVCLTDDGEITFSWRAADDTGEHWRAVLAIAPDAEVECFVRRRSNHEPVDHFRTEDGVALFRLPDDIVDALRLHWRAAQLSADACAGTADAGR